MKNFVTKTISYKIQLQLAMKYVITKKKFVAIFVTKKFVAKTYFLFLIFSYL